MSPVPAETLGRPFIFGTDAFISISVVGLNCIANKVALKPDTTVETSTTLCGATDYPGATKWMFEATLYQSFEDFGTYDVLSAALLGGVPVPFVLRFDGDTAGPNNPEFTGELVLQPFDIVDSDAG